MRAWVLAAASSMRSLGMPASIALAMPPSSSTSLDVAPGLLRELGGQPLDIERAAPGVDDAGGAALLLQEELGVAGDARGEVGRQRQRLVERVGVQRLGVPLGRRHRLDRGAHDVVEHVLRGERPARGLAMGAQRQRARVLGIERLHQLRPQQARGAQLGDLHEEVHADRPEERQPRREAGRWSSPAARPARTYSTPSASV